MRCAVLFEALLFAYFTCISSPLTCQSKPGTNTTTKLPRVLAGNHADLVFAGLKLEAALKFSTLKLPDNLNDWKVKRTELRNEILKKASVVENHDLALNIKETGRIEMKGYTVRNITFQTSPGIYETANLYVPDGSGPFPGVINMPGHWNKGKIDSTGPQAVGHSLASNGYVCLTIDPWGSGERTTINGIFEDHGDENNLGAALMNVGKPLIGIEISDNIRGVDLLCSLPYVDPEKIGATGASGGGNQTMWLTSLDERIKAAMCVVSAGTFESHIMGSPCICEVMPGALTFTEEAGVISLIAPRAMKMCNHKKDDIPAFQPSEMVRSYNNAKPIFKLYGAENNISYELFDLPHGYWKEDREALLGWFDLHLKGTGTGTARKEIPFKQLPETKLIVFQTGQRDTNITGTVDYCIKRGNYLKTTFLNSATFDIESKRKGLCEILGSTEKPVLKHVYPYPETEGWDRFALETSDNKLIPLLVRTGSDNKNEFIIISNPEGKDKIPSQIIDEAQSSGKSIAIVDLSGTGEASANSLAFNYKVGKLRAISRSELWFGKTILGEWVNELESVNDFLRSRYKASKVSVDGTRETAIAGLLLGALGNDLYSITLREAPVSYLFDTRKGIEFFSNGIHLPDFLLWGDVSLAAALSGKSVVFINPVSMSGNIINGEKLSSIKAEFEIIRTRCNQSGKTEFLVQ